MDYDTAYSGRLVRFLSTHIKVSNKRKINVICREIITLKHRCLIWSKFIHLAVCVTTGPKPLPKRTLRIVRSRASSSDYPRLSLRSSSSFVCLLPRLTVTSIPPFIFPSIPGRRRQFLRKIWPIQLPFRWLISCRIFLSSLALSNTSSFLTWFEPNT
jgi:hypothetical protein